MRLEYVLANICKVAEENPTLTIVVDHCGGTHRAFHASVLPCFRAIKRSLQLLFYSLSSIEFNVLPVCFGGLFLFCRLLRTVFFFHFDDDVFHFDDDDTSLLEGAVGPVGFGVAGVEEKWRGCIEKLASYPNVCVFFLKKKGDCELFA